MSIESGLFKAGCGRDRLGCQPYLYGLFPAPAGPRLAPAPFYLLSCTWLVYFGSPGSLNPGAEAGELGR